MSLTTTSEALCRELQGVASDLKWSTVELLRIAERLSLAGNEADAQAILRMCQIFRKGEDRLTEHADDAKAGRIVYLNRE